MSKWNKRNETKVEPIVETQVDLPPIETVTMTVTEGTAEELAKEVILPAGAIEQLVTTEQVKPETVVETTEYDHSKVLAMRTKSEQIRYLSACGLKRGAIAKLLTKIYGKTVLYQH